MDDASTQARIRDLLAADRRTKRISDGWGPHDDLITAGIIDSLSLLELIARLEKEFKISIEDTEVVPEDFSSLSSIALFVRRKTGDRA